MTLHGISGFHGNARFELNSAFGPWPPLAHKTTHTPESTVQSAGDQVAGLWVLTGISPASQHGSVDGVVSHVCPHIQHQGRLAIRPLL